MTAQTRAVLLLNCFGRVQSFSTEARTWCDERGIVLIADDEYASHQEAQREVPGAVGHFATASTRKLLAGTLRRSSRRAWSRW